MTTIQPYIYQKVQAYLRTRPSVQSAMVKADTGVLSEHLSLYAAKEDVSQEEVVALAHVVGLNQLANELAFTHGLKLQVEALASDAWWNSLNRDQQQQYIELHPASKYAHDQLNQQPQTQQAPAQPQQPAPQSAEQAPAPQPVAPVVQPPVQQPAAQPQAAPPVAQQPVQPIPVVPQPAVQPQQVPVAPPAQPQAVQQPSPNDFVDDVSQQPVQPQVPAKPPLTERLKQKLASLPSTAAKFFHGGGTEKGSNERRNAGQHIRDKSHAFAKHLIHQGREVKEGVHGLHKLAMTRSWTELNDHEKKAIKALGVEAATLIGGIALTGGVSHLVHAPAMIALKHVGGHWFAEAAMKAAGHAVIHAATETAGTDEEKMLVNFINSIADMLENGEIPDEAWEKAADDISAGGSDMHAPPKDAVSEPPRAKEKTPTEDVTDSDRPSVTRDSTEEQDPDNVDEVPTDKDEVEEQPIVRPEDKEGAPEDDTNEDAVDKDVPVNPDAMKSEPDAEPGARDDADRQNEEEDDIPEMTRKEAEKDAEGVSRTNTQSDENTPVSDTPEASGDSDLDGVPDSDTVDEIPAEKKEKVEVKEDVKPCSHCGHTEEDEAQDEDDIEEVPVKKEESSTNRYYVEKDTSTALWCVFDENTNKAVSSYASKQDADADRDVHNKKKEESALTDTDKIRIRNQIKSAQQQLKLAGRTPQAENIRRQIERLKDSLKASTETSRIKGTDEYTWLKYTGKPIILNFRGTRYTLNKGDEFGVRMSSNKKDKRLIVDKEGLGLTKVMTLTPELEMALSTKCETATYA